MSQLRFKVVLYICIYIETYIYKKSTKVRCSVVNILAESCLHQECSNCFIQLISTFLMKAAYFCNMDSITFVDFYVSWCASFTIDTYTHICVCQSVCVSVFQNTCKCKGFCVLSYLQTKQIQSIYVTL